MNIDQSQDLELNHHNEDDKIEQDDLNEDNIFNIPNFILNAFNMSNSFEKNIENKSNKISNKEMKDKSILKKNHYMVHSNNELLLKLNFICFKIFDYYFI